MGWRLAPTLVQLRSEVNACWPLRDKDSDGTLGNAAHQARRSDHNPDDRGVVCAMDFDEDLTDPSGGFHPGQNARVFVDRLLELAHAGKVPQLYYVIYERRIYSRTHGFEPRPYDGLNAHDHHVHVSVYHDPRLADRQAMWGIAAPPPTLPDQGDDMSGLSDKLDKFGHDFGWYAVATYKQAKAANARTRVLADGIEKILGKLVADDPAEAKLAAELRDISKQLDDIDAELDDEPA